MNPRMIDIDGPELNQARAPGQSAYYATPCGDVTPETIAYVLDLLAKTVDNPNKTVSKDKLRHIAAQLLARNVIVEQQNDYLRGRIDHFTAELAKLQGLANIVEMHIDTTNVTNEEVAAALKAAEYTERYRLMQGH